MDMSRCSASSSGHQVDASNRETASLLSNAKKDPSYGSTVDDASAGGQGSSAQIPSKISRITPLPVKQIAVLAFMRTAGPMAFNQVSPYINEMIERIGVTDDPKEVGYYSGIVQSTFAFVQAMTVLKTGIIADQFGRKTIILLSLLGQALSTLIFGLSKTLWLAIATRALAGLVGGSSMLINSAVGDITDESNQAQAYAFIGLAFNAASVIAPLLGGVFATPEVTFPGTLGRINFLREFPYFLPCAISALWVFLSFIAGLLYMKETKLHRPVLKKTAACYSTEDVNEEIRDAERLSAWRLALDPVLFSVLRTFFILNALNGAASSVFTLFAYTPVKDGGLSRNPAEIGNIIASSGLIISLLEVLAISKLQRHFGTLKLLRFSMALWPFCFAMFPFVNFIASTTMVVNHQIGGMDSQTAEKLIATEPASVAVWIAVLVLLVVQRVATMAYPLCLMLFKNAAPSNEVLGTVFGLSQLVGCISRAVAPAFISSLFAFSKEHPAILGGNFVWAVMVVFSLIGLRMAFTVRDGCAERLEALDSSD